MKQPPSRIDTLRSISALGAGVLLAATPHCGGKSEGSGDDSNGGTQNDRGGSGNASNGGHVGVPVTGGYGGVGVTGGYGGSYGGTFGGAVGIGGTCGNFPSLCWTPEELRGCAQVVDAGADVIILDGGSDTGTGEGGAAGAAGEAPPEPELPRPGSGAVPPPPEGFACPYQPPFPQCVMSTNPPPAVFFSVSPSGWNGTQCCYVFNLCN